MEKNGNFSLSNFPKGRGVEGLGTRLDCHAAEALAYMQGSQDDRKQSRAGSKVTQPTIQSPSQAQAPPDCSKNWVGAREQGYYFQ